MDTGYTVKYSTYSSVILNKSILEKIPYALCCFVNPLLDFVSVVPDEFLQQYKLQRASFALASDDQIRLYDDLIERNKNRITTDSYYSLTFLAGGSALNSCRIFQAMMQQLKQELHDLQRKNSAELVTRFLPSEKHINEYSKNKIVSVCESNSKCIVFGSVGKDLEGSLVKKQCEEENIKCLFYESDELKTGKCAVLVDEKHERTLCTYLGACRDFTYENTHKKIHTFNNETCLSIMDICLMQNIFYTTGYILSTNPQGVVEIAKSFAPLENKLFTFAIAAEFIINVYSDLIKDIITYSNIIVGNEAETKALSEILNLPPYTNLNECTKLIMLYIAQHSQCRGDICFIATHGSKPLVYATVNFNREKKYTLDDIIIKEFEPSKIKQDEIVDTNGAGDAFIGGYLFGQCLHLNVADSVKMGFYASKNVIQRRGFSFCFSE